MATTVKKPKASVTKKSAKTNDDNRPPRKVAAKKVVKKQTKSKAVEGIKKSPSRALPEDTKLAAIQVTDPARQSPREIDPPITKDTDLPQQEKKPVPPPLSMNQGDRQKATNDRKLPIENNKRWEFVDHPWVVTFGIVAVVVILIALLFLTNKPAPSSVPIATAEKTLAITATALPQAASLATQTVPPAATAPVVPPSPSPIGPTPVSTAPASGFVFTNGVPTDWSYNPSSAPLGLLPAGSFWDLMPLRIHVEHNALVFNPDNRNGAKGEKFHKVGIYKPLTGAYQIAFSLHTAFFEEYASRETTLNNCAEQAGNCTANIFIGWGDPVPDDHGAASGNFFMYRRDGLGRASLCHAQTVFKDCKDPSALGINNNGSGEADFTVVLIQNENDRTIILNPNTWYQKTYLITKYSKDQTNFWIGYDLRKPVYVEISITAAYQPK